ncbi:1,4-dihydroxy-2-naphthoyl-CoA hydrolase [Humitalea rosea]|uniref:1,4-dihydroxy-2-naphthoyl-CoA hydrolase n=1 Tax=Humitalea rosea TaxID=990373 RepID=A0A2W7I7E0_9PROT|nr:hotdog fold thioesterase [Humitalea rosea]PZW42179.1 1,4-dihydroxy-2-naphthoyl-CoA hydrolase [Humitalea rosea]
MSIWKKPADPDAVNARMENTLSALLGIRITEFGPDWVKAEMPVDARHVQPHRILHGGCSVVLSETIGSMACYQTLGEGRICVGLEINANHIASVPEGETVTAICRALHIGRSTQIWQTEIFRADGKLACISRLTCAVLDRRVARA